MEASHLLNAGLFGLGGLTVIFPILALLWKPKTNLRPAAPITAPPRIDILIAATNEESNLPLTLRSIQEACEMLNIQHLGATITIGVAAMGCTDHTIQNCRACNVEPVILPAPLGKLEALRRLVLAKEGADWVIFVDPGTIWPTAFLVQLIEVLQRKGTSLAGVSPSFAPTSQNPLKKALWTIERTLRKIENDAGGPVVAHSATVVYPRQLLVQALQYLSSPAWRDEEVVLPLSIRALHPELLFYFLPFLEVSRRTSVPVNHRKTLQGHLQWIVSLWPFIWKLSPTAGILATRQVFRVFWAYWFLLAWSGFVLDRLASPDYWIEIALLGFLLHPVSRNSLLAPFLLIKTILKK